MLSILNFVMQISSLKYGFINFITMEVLQYKIIKTEGQYWEYCNILEKMLKDKDNGNNEDEIELLTFLIEKWDNEHSTLNTADPVEILKYLMDENNLKAKDLSELLGVGKSTISEILNYRKGFSKEIIRKLATHFKVQQEAFNRPYKLDIEANNSIIKSHPQHQKTLIKSH